MRASAERPPLLRSTPLISTSRPVSVRVTCSVGADFGCSNSGAARRFSAGMAAWIFGSEIGQTAMSTRSQDLRIL